MDNKKLNEICPSDFNEDQGLEYDNFLRTAKLLYPDYDEWILKMGIEAYIRLDGKDRPEINEEEVNNIKSQYDTTTTLYETPQDLKLEYKEAPVEFISCSILDNGENLQTNNEEGSIPE